MSLMEKQLELLVVERLKQLGYPDEAIATEWKTRNCWIDIIVFDDVTNIPLMIVECKCVKNAHSLEAVGNQLRMYSDSLDYPVRAYAAVSTETDAFEFYDFTERLKDPSIPISQCGPTDIPAYETIKTGAKNKFMDSQKKKKRKYITGLRVVCWGIIPILTVGLGILDATGLYPLTTERLILLGILLLSLLLPFFGEVKEGELTLSHKREGEEK